MRHTESKCQQALIKWWALAHRGLGVPDPRVLFAIPNGGARSAITGLILKSEGVRAGVPDLFLAVPRHNLSGLFIEMKTWEGRVQSEQYAMMALLRSQGFEAVVARGFDHAQRAITLYLGGKEIQL